MNRFLPATLLLVSLAQSADAASVFRCMVNGRTVFQQSACANDDTPTRAEAASAPAVPGASAPARKAPKPSITPAITPAIAPAAAPASAASTPAKPARPAKPG